MYMVDVLKFKKKLIACQKGLDKQLSTDSDQTFSEKVVRSGLPGLSLAKRPRQAVQTQNRLFLKKQSVRVFSACESDFRTFTI